MIDESELFGIDPFALLDVESERVMRHFASLDEKGWQQPTRCEGWRVREMLSHFRGGELYNRACLDDAVATLMQRASTEGSVHDLDSFSAWINDIYADRERDALLAEWHAENVAVRNELRERGDDGELTTMVGPYSVRLQAFHLAQEYATHADDMNVAVAADEVEARRDWRARFTRFALTELDRPVTVEQRGGRNVIRVSTDGADGDDVILSDDDLIEAGQGRLPGGALPPGYEELLRTNG